MGDMEQLKKLREPFPPEQIGKLPKGGVTLDFVGHGYLTQRLLDVDPLWSWEPLSLDENGLPRFDEFGGLWIKLTVCGVTRLGYGDAGGRKGANAVKEMIGDALRNAGMRFGMALDLWSKGDPDAPQPPTRKRIAQDELMSVCKRHGLVPGDVGQRFADEYGHSVAQAEAAVIEAFAKIIDEENSAS
jgi:hypothetical protein